MGGLSGLNTLSAQAFGAQNFHRLGHLLQRMLAICGVFCMLVFFVWWFFTGTILRAVGMPEETIPLAVSFTRVYFPVLPAMLAVQATQSFLRAQRIVKPVTKISVVAAMINLPVTWACVNYLGFIGAPLAQVIGAWVLLFIYIIYFR